MIVHRTSDKTDVKKLDDIRKKEKRRKEEREREKDKGGRRNNE